MAEGVQERGTSRTEYRVVNEVGSVLWTGTDTIVARLACVEGSRLAGPGPLRVEHRTVEVVELAQPWRPFEG